MSRLRRLVSSIIVLLLAASCTATRPDAAAAREDGAGTLVNDVHSQLNPARVDRIVTPRSVEEIRKELLEARREGKAVSIAGARHAMGGQQFGTGTILIDMTQMNRVLNFDRERGLVEAEAGTTWPALVDYLLEAQKQSGARQWGIRQKQT